MSTFEKCLEIQNRISKATMLNNNLTTRIRVFDHLPAAQRALEQAQQNMMNSVSNQIAQQFKIQQTIADRMNMQSVQRAFRAQQNMINSVSRQIAQQVQNYQTIAERMNISLPKSPTMDLISSIAYKSPILPAASIHQSSAGLISSMTAAMLPLTDQIKTPIIPIPRNTWSALIDHLNDITHSENWPELQKNIDSDCDVEALEVIKNRTSPTRQALKPLLKRRKKTIEKAMSRQYLAIPTAEIITLAGFFLSNYQFVGDPYLKNQITMLLTTIFTILILVQRNQKGD